jgi:hypothetical protein
MVRLQAVCPQTYSQSGDIYTTNQRDLIWFEVFDPSRFSSEHAAGVLVPLVP